MTEVAIQLSPKTIPVPSRITKNLFIKRLHWQGLSGDGCVYALARENCRHENSSTGLQKTPFQEIDQSLTEPDRSLLASVRDDRFEQFRIWVSV
jgi:hypothetical protein